MPTRAKSPRPPEANGHAAPAASRAGPPPLATFDTEALRRTLAGLADPSATTGAISPPAIKELAVRFVSVLAALFNRDDLDAITLWDRIGSALTTADAKAPDDALQFASLCLEHVQADPGRAAASPALGAVLDTLDRAKPEDRAAWLAYLRTHRYPALAFGRARWELVKAKEAEL